MKQILKYIGIFALTLTILFCLLSITAKIPRKATKENIRESHYALKTTQEVYEKVKRRDYTFLHIAADKTLLNIIYCIDSDNAIESVMEARFYSRKKELVDNFSMYDERDLSINKSTPYTNLEKIVDNELEGNEQYLRYWHGSMSIVRPLLVFFNLQQIYIINAVILAILIATLIIVLLKKKHIDIAITLIIGLVMCWIFTVPFCLEYIWMFLIMLITSIIAVLIEKKESKLSALFFITGMLTCYFDFLTTEIITLFIPLTIVLVIRYKDGRISNLKQGIKFIFKLGMLWSISYVVMWFAKWILASIILKINAFEYVKDNAILRVNGSVWGTTKANLPFTEGIHKVVTTFTTLGGNVCVWGSQK